MSGCQSLSSLVSWSKVAEVQALPCLGGERVERVSSGVERERASPGGRRVLDLELWGNVPGGWTELHTEVDYDRASEWAMDMYVCRSAIWGGGVPGSDGGADSAKMEAECQGSRTKGGSGWAGVPGEKF